MLSSERRNCVPRRSPYVIELSLQERGVLERMAAKYSSPYRDVMRAKIVLYAAQGLSNEEIASRLDVPRQVVSKWRKRFYQEGTPGLAERPRRGRPAVFSPAGRG
jgi:DNA-directed RNA polymerase specialized sigma24 family protein